MSDLQNSSGKIYTAIPAIIADVQPVGKNVRNPQQGYMYRSADDICDALHDALGKHKVFATCEIVDRAVTERESKGGGLLFYVALKTKYTFHAEDGSSISTDAWGEAMDSGDKATNKAMTAAYKYALIQVFCMMGHEDSETQTPQAVAPQRTPTRQQKVKEEKLASLEAAEKKNDLGSSKPVDDHTEDPRKSHAVFSEASTKILNWQGTPQQWEAYKGKVRMGLVAMRAENQITDEQETALENMLSKRDEAFAQTAAA